MNRYGTYLGTGKKKQQQQKKKKKKKKKKPWFFMAKTVGAFFLKK